MRHVFTALSVIFIFLCISCSEKRYTEPLSLEEALKSFQLNDEFTIEIFAAEPFVMDPVEMVFDEGGNVFVVEMPDYPFKPEKGKAAGRIRKLVDTNNDGRIDDSIIFADSLSEATSILPWQGGLIVTAAPHILYLKDTTGDFRADTKEILFTGFFENNSEAQITNLRFSVDNWIYASNHGQDGKVTFSRKPDAPALSMKGADFRFRLDRNQFEAETAPAQFGQAIDDWGHRFMTQNTLHIRHAVIPGRYLRRHPYLPSTNAVENISDHELVMFQQTPPPYWRAQRTKRRNKQYAEQKLDRTEYAEDHFTGSSGGTFYGGHAFPDKFYGNIFTGDVAGNLVHRDVITPLDSSPTFVAMRDHSEKEREFLSSTDPWFRPANFTVGPDGYLYVIDMYRQHIETPLSIPEDLKADMDFLRGSDLGRIYRIVPKNSPSSEKASTNLRKKDTQTLVEVLAHPNQWWRLQAQRLLLERQDTSVVPALKTMFTSHKDPRARLHAFFVLEGLNSLDATLVKQAMQDNHPGVREYGVILAEHYPECLPGILEKINDQSARVALQASLSLGEFSDKQVASALAEVMEKYSQDPWFKMAVLSSEAGSSLNFLELLIKKSAFFNEAKPEKISFLEDFSYIIGMRNREGEVARFVNLLSDGAKEKEDWKMAGLTGLAKGMEKSENKPKADAHLKEVLQSLQANATDSTKAAVQTISKLLE